MATLRNTGIPLEAQYLYRHGMDYSMEGKMEDAMTSLRKAVLIAPHFCAAYNVMGNCLDRMGRYEEAIGKYEKVIELDPSHAEARFKRDLVLLKIWSGSEGNTGATMDEVPQKQGTVHNDKRLLSGTVRSIRIFGCDM
jgi:tetratricopeptide (TPR) repeat protein